MSSPDLFHCFGIVTRRDGSDHKPGKPEVVREFYKHGKLEEFSGNSVQPQQKLFTNKIVSV